MYTVHWGWGASAAFATGSGDDAIRVFTRSRPSASEGEGESASTSATSEAAPVGAFRLSAVVRSAHSGDVNSVRWNPRTAGLLASAGDDGFVRLWRNPSLA